MVMPMEMPGGSVATGDDEVHGAPVLSRDQAEGYVAMVCFKHGPPRLQGVELEWTLHHEDDPARAVELTDLARALGPHAPTTVDPHSPHLPLPAGSLVTVEPGGQVEISSAPTPSVAFLLEAAADDDAALGELLAPHGLRRGEHGLDPHRTPRRILRTPRYDAMEDFFAAIGPHGSRMMCSTASLQVCVDLGEGTEAVHRWDAVHALGPTLTALFGNSAVMAGSDTGWVSARLRSTLATAPPATFAPARTADPVAQYARMALEAPLLCVRREQGPWAAPVGVRFADWVADPSPVGRPPTTRDLDYHLSTLFPPVRPHGYLEVRYLDAQPGRGWMTPVALLTALLSRPETVGRVLEATEETADRWLSAARVGVADPGLARSATAVVELGVSALDGQDLPRAVADEVTRQLQERIEDATSRRCSA
ncbi:ergothioneine biosynthesis glutamate--cysteine ligase EgtA [Oryzihumus sp.]